MIFTVNEDGTFIGSDSDIFRGGSHSTAHGEWQRESSRSIKAEATLLQSAPTGQFIGAFKHVLSAMVVNPDEMRGTFDAYQYAFVSPTTGAVIVDGDGFPTPSPLAPAVECGSTPGCTSLGTFAFTVRRVSVR
jgi:hypothetical protein